MTTLLSVLAIGITYCIGSIPTGVWYSRYKHRDDVRNHGSGNSGATNIGRTYGFKAAIFVALCDTFKGWIPVALAVHFLSDTPYVVAGVALAAVIGHAYPIWANFRGGKIVATSIGVLLGFQFFVGLAMLALFVSLLYLTSTVSLASMTSYTVTAFYLFFSLPNKIYGLTFLLIALFMIYRHRENVVRLINRNEKRIKFGLNQPKE